MNDNGYHVIRLGDPTMAEIDFQSSLCFSLHEKTCRIIQYAREGKIRVLFNSNVKQIRKENVILSSNEEGIERNFSLENNYTFVLAGGEPPYPLLKSIGVEFGGGVNESSPTKKTRYSMSINGNF